MTLYVRWLNDCRRSMYGEKTSCSLLKQRNNSTKYILLSVINKGLKMFSFSGFIGSAREYYKAFIGTSPTWYGLNKDSSTYLHSGETLSTWDVCRLFGSSRSVCCVSSHFKYSHFKYSQFRYSHFKNLHLLSWCSSSLFMWIYQESWCSKVFRI